MQIMSKLSNIAHSLTNRPSAARRDGSNSSASGAAGCRSYVLVKDYNSGLYLRVPV